MPNYLDFTGTALGKHLQHVCPSAPAPAIDLLSQLLKLDPNKRLKASEVHVHKRISATSLVFSSHNRHNIQALDHPYFRSEPLASTPSMLVAAVKRASTITPKVASVTRSKMVKTGIATTESNTEYKNEDRARPAKRIRLGAAKPLRAPSFDE